MQKLSLRLQQAGIKLLEMRYQRTLRRSMAKPVAAPSLPGPRRQPVIIIGMHRSGTSLFTQLLHEAGIFMGHNLPVPNYEARFFERRNRAIFGIASARWDDPAPARLLLADAHACDALALQLYQELRSWNIAAYLGPQRYAKSSSLWELDALWGWKDPRTTVTLPIWMRLFPQARIVHVIRNGIDVANSLVVREQKRYQKSGAAYFRCMDYASAFDLWSTYLDIALDLTSALPAAQVHTVLYEQLLADPTVKLRAALEFLDYELPPARLSAITAGIRPERANAFRTSPQLSALYEQRKYHHHMQQLGYSQGA
jgi:hypothetical protein